MVLVRDKKGYLFGGYAAEGWSKHGQYYGSELSFIFGILPTLIRYRASGANQNMLWCGQGFSQLPNGIGWGGKVSHATQKCPTHTFVVCPWSVSQTHQSYKLLVKLGTHGNRLPSHG